jgi:hypothetical protein
VQDGETGDLFVAPRNLEEFSTGADEVEEAAV